jgi:hypothetical protein
MAPIAPSPAGPGGGDGDNGFDRVLAADDPAALASFYGALLEVEPQPGLSPSHWRLPWPAGGWLEVYGHREVGPNLSSWGDLGSACNVRRMQQEPLRCSKPGSPRPSTWASARGSRRAGNRLAPKPGCWTRRPTACCCLWCLPREAPLGWHHGSAQAA